MSDDIFDHPDLRDPAWDRKLKSETRRRFWRRNLLRLSFVLAVLVLIAAAVVYSLFRDASPPRVPVPLFPLPETTETTETGLPITPATMETG